MLYFPRSVTVNDKMTVITEITQSSWTRSLKPSQWAFVGALLYLVHAFVSPASLFILTVAICHSLITSQ